MNFTFDPSRPFIDVPRRDIAALYESVNQASVLVPGQTNAPAKAVVVGHRMGAGFEVVVGLHVVSSGHHLVFTRGDAAPLDSEGARNAARDALAFVESMGFFMENANVAQLPPEEREELLERLAVFSPPSARAVTQERKSDPLSKLARLLVQL